MVHISKFRYQWLIITLECIFDFLQYLSMTVQKNDVPGQARGLCILASLYQEKRQLLKAHEYYKKVNSSL